MKNTTPQGFVYVIHAAGTNRIKLGYSAQPEDRIRKLQTGSPVELRMLARYPGSRATEARLHSALAEYRKGGEWFEVPPFIGLLIHQIASGRAKEARVRPCRPSNKHPTRSTIEYVKSSTYAWAVRYRWKEQEKRKVRYVARCSQGAMEVIDRKGRGRLGDLLRRYYDASRP
jgi:hypothetical protein